MAITVFAGTTITDKLKLRKNGVIEFEGATNNNFETTLSLVDPTADNQILFKDESGTVAFLSDLSGGSVSGSGTGGTISVWTGCGASTVLGDSPLTISGCQTLFPNGTGAIPSIAPASDTNTGLSFPPCGGGRFMRYSLGGVTKVDFLTNSFQVFTNSQFSGIIQTVNCGPILASGTLGTAIGVVSIGEAASCTRVEILNNNITANVSQELADGAGSFAIDAFMTVDFTPVRDSKAGIFIDADQLRALERSSDPTAPIEGSFVIWMTDGTGTGDDGDILISIQAGAVIKTTTLIDFSSLP